MNLLWNGVEAYESIIDENTFQDLGIISLFEKFRQNIYDILDIIKYIPNEETIKYRGNIFDDFLIDEENYYLDIKKLADDVVYFYKAYNLIKQTLKRHIVFLLCINSYLSFYEKSYELLNKSTINSEGFLNLKEHIHMVIKSSEFNTLKDDYNNISFDRIKNYIVSNKGKFIAVEEADEYEALNNVLRKLAEELSPEIHIRNYSYSGKEIDSLYLAALEKVYSDETNALSSFHMKYAKLEFPLSQLGDQIGYYLFFKSIFRECKLPYCVPQLNSEIIKFNNVHNVSLYGITENIIPNEVTIKKVTVVTGVNGGGKTSFLQSIGNSYVFLFAVGHVFADSAQMANIKYLYTHFPNNELFKIGYGRLKNELYRLDKISKNFSKDCLLLLNETFSSTDSDTAYDHAKKLIGALQANKTKCIYVTHHQNVINIIDIDILVPLTDKNNKRLFKIVRKTDDINMYTFDILYRYKMTKEQLEARLTNEEV